jgi:ATP/maltotriose-dependent transcriptional regulator MalT/DNA-binding SARP family transcriptional activator
MPANPLVLAKLSRPRLRDELVRTRLHGVLDEAVAHPVVWIAAQPGAGKTALAAGWLESRKRGGIWYQLDPGDDDPASFVYHLQAAAPPARKGGQPLPLLRPEYLGDLAGFARRFSRELFSRLLPHGTLVLDNFQEVPEASLLHKLIVCMLEQVPPGVNVLVISRIEPPAGYATLIASQAISVLDAGELQFTLEETAALAQRRGISDPRLVQQLHARSSGWAAGLTLLLARGVRDGAVPDPGDTASLQHVFGYFAQRVFDERPAPQQQNLMRLSFLPQMSAGLARDLTESEDAVRLLEQLHRRHMFTEQRRRQGDRAEAVYQFNELFRTFLQHRAEHAWTDEERRSLSARAGRLLEQAGWGEDALALLARGGDWEGYARVVCAHAESAIAHGRRQTVKEWLDAMPPAEMERSPWLGYWQGRSLLQSAPQDAVAVLEKACERFRQAGDVAGQLACGAAVVNALWFTRLGWSEVAPWVERLEPLLHQHVTFPSGAIELTSYAALHAALAFYRLDHPAIPGLARRLLALVGDDDLDWTQRLTTATHLITFLHNSGEDDLVRQLMGKVDPVVESRPASALSRSFWYTFRAIHDMRNARYEESSERFQRAEDLARTEGLLQAEYAALQFRIYLDIVFRRLDDAQARLARTELHPARSSPDAEMNHWLAQTLLAQARHDVIAAHGHAQRTLKAIERVGAAYFRATFRPLLASAFADGGDFVAARELIASSRNMVRGTYLDVMETQLLLEEAHVENACGDSRAALALVARALALAQTGSGLNAYAQRVLSRNRSLLELALAEGIETDYVRREIRMWRLSPPKEEIPGWPWPIRVRTLGSFEVLVDDAPVEFGRKVPKRPLAVLKAVVARGGSCPESVLIDAFWRDEAGDQAAKSLGVAVHRLRALLGDSEAVAQQGGLVTLDRSRVWVDAWTFERSLERARERRDLDATSAALALYRGAFLAEEEGESWPLAMRERLRSKYIQAVDWTGKHLEAQGRMLEAIECYWRGLDADNVVEPFYQGLMRCYQRLDRMPEAVSAYRRLKQILSVTLSLQPSTATEKLYRSLRLDLAERAE